MNKKLSLTNFQRGKKKTVHKGLTPDKKIQTLLLPSPQKGTADKDTGLMP